MLRRNAFVCALVSAFVSALAFTSTVSAQSATAILDRVQVNPRRQIDFHSIVLPESVYVGQQATYQVAVLLSPDARSRLRRNPEFLPPELRGLLAYELGSPTRIAPRSYDGAVFEAHVFQRALFPVAAGLQTVPAPQLSYSLPQSSSYFSREERFVVRAESASFVARALPTDGRPDDFNGAVGVFKSSVRIDTTVARVGDPVVLTLRVQGVGNVKLLPRPSIEMDWASAVAGAERVQVDSSGPLVRGTKEFDWILTPARDGRVSVPVLRYSYFDPYTSRYAVAESSPVELSVRPGSLAEVDETEAGALLPLRHTSDIAVAVEPWTGRTLPPRSWWVWLLLLALAPLPWIWWSRKSTVARSRTEKSSGPALTNNDRLAGQAPTNGARELARSLRRTLLDALASRFGQTSQSFVSRLHVARVLRRGGVTRSTTREVLTLLERLDELGFAELEPDAASTQWVGGAARVVSEMLRRIDSEAIPKGRVVGPHLSASLAMMIGALPLALACSMLLSSPLVAQPANTSASVRPDDQAAAQQAYERRAFSDASQRYGALVVTHPNDVDLLANWGTASWAAGDTVSAVIAWQRAARLEPLATDLQERVSLLPSGARGGVADVPMIPVIALTRLAIVAWVLAWILLAARAKRRRRAVRTVSTGLSRIMYTVATTALIIAVAAGATAWWGVLTLDATKLAVVARPETLRIAPGTDADAMGGVTTGDVVRVEESRESWYRIVHADGRRGWLPVQRLVPVIQVESNASATTKTGATGVLPVDPNSR